MKPPPVHSHSSGMSYRADIDGLRGIAVLCVIIYHAFPSLLRGGFIGVDVFFVISGFLITTILLQDLARGTFSLASFYARRIRRIFPALLLVLGSCYVAGIYLLLPSEFLKLSKHIAGGSAFIANILLQWESGYFEPAAETNPLMHLWSLGIEEQFYIAWPLLLLLLWKRTSRLVWGLAALCALSFAYNLYLVQHNTTAAFFGVAARAWELFAGALLAAWVQKNNIATAPQWMNWLAPAGLLLILASAFALHAGMVFPGFLALLPVVGAVGIIAGGINVAGRRWLAPRWLVGVGLISYPLYLWHWPLLTFARILHPEMLSVAARAGLLAASFILAWLTYRYVERLLRFHWRGRVVPLVLAAGMLCMAVIGYATYQKQLRWGQQEAQAAFLDHFENVRPQMRYFERIDLERRWRVECGFFDGEAYRRNELSGNFAETKRGRALLEPACVRRDPKYAHAVLLWGNSHAQALSPGLTRYLPSNTQFLQVASSACAVDTTAEHASEQQCPQTNFWAMKTIRETRPDVVVIAGIDGLDKPALQLLARRVLDQGAGHVIVVGPTPHWRSDLPLLLARSAAPVPTRTWRGVDREAFAMNHALALSLQDDPDLTYIDAMQYFCTAAGCLTYTGDDMARGITSWDTVHITPLASEMLANDVLVKAIANAMKR